MKAFALLTLEDRNRPLIEDIEFAGTNIEPLNLQARFFALAPLSNRPVTQTVELAEFGADGKLWEVNSLLWSGIDAEALAIRFTTDVDAFLGMAAVAPVYETSGINQQVVKIAGAKITLAAKIAAGLGMFFDLPLTGNPAALQSARQTFEQQLVASLSSAYITAVLVQLEVAAAAQPPHARYLNFPVNPQTYLQRNLKGTFGFYYPAMEVKEDGKAETGVVKEESAHNNPVPVALKIPVPLRRIPQTPVGIKQQPEQHKADEPITISELLLWNYHLIVDLPPAQDELAINVMFNPPIADVALNAEAALPAGLFNALAQYNYVAADLFAMLATPPAGLPAPPQEFQNAVTTLASLVADVAEQWPAAQPGDTAPLLPGLPDLTAITYQFTARATYHKNGGVNFITITNTGAPITDDDKWPQLSVQTSPENFTNIEAGTITGQAAVYNIDDAAIVNPVIKLSWPELNLLAASSACARSQVIRNNHLVPGINTSPAFITVSGTVTTETIHQSNLVNAPVNITSLGDDFAAAMNTCFEELFGMKDYEQLVAIKLSYGQPISADAASGTPLMAYLPVVDYPKSMLSPTAAGEIARFAEQWRTVNQLQAPGGEWSFSLNVYGPEPAPLLAVERLFYELTDGEEISS